MAGQPPRTTLATVGLEVARLFSELVSVERLIGDDKHPEWPQSLFRAEYDRFELWAVNLGLFIPGHGSLDYRVRDAPSLRGALMRFIVDLKDSLSQVLEYSHGSVDVTVSLQSGDLDDDVGDGMSPSPSLLGDDSSSFELVGEVDSDIDLFLDSIKDPIDRLYKLSTRIRNPITRFGSSKARQYRKIDPDSNCDLLQAFQPFDQDYVSSLLLQYRKSSAVQLSPPQATATEPEDEGDAPTYPDNVWEPFRSLLARYDEETSRGEENFLVRRLAQANVQRRKQFGYWMRHREKLVLHTRSISQEVQLPVGVIKISDEPMAQAAGNTAAQQAVAGDLSVTTATRLQAAQLAVRDDQSTVSVSEYAPSTYVSDDSPDFPVPPRIEDGQKYFECPYCFTLCPSELLRLKAWRAHLIRDMRPYVCTYEDCCNPDQLYDTRQDWIEHEGSCHRKVWRCPDHVEQYFTSIDSLRHHLADGHVTGIATASNDFTRASESVLTLAGRCCPICQFSTEMATDLQKHIAIHLERIALFSLPRSAGNDDDDAGSESVNLPDDDSREDDNSDDFRFDADEDDGDSDDGSGQPVRSAAEKARRGWKLAIDAVCKRLGSDVNTRLSRSSSWKSPLHAMRAEAEELVQQGRLRQAEELYDNILDARRRALGSHHPRTLTSMSDLASVYEQQGLKKKADELLAQVAEVRLLLSANPLVGAANLAVPYRNQGRPEDAKDLERRLMTAAEQDKQQRQRHQAEAEAQRRAARTATSTDTLSVSECQARLFDAVRTSNHVAVDLLLSIDGVNPDAFDSNLRTPLSWAAGFGDIVLVRKFLGMSNVDADSPDARGQTPLSWAADCGHSEVVGLLLESGRVNPNSRDASGWTPLAWAASKGYEEVVRLFLAREDVDVHAKSVSGPTPLEWAVIHGYDKVVKVFLDSGLVDADVLSGPQGKSLIGYAEKSGNEALVELLEDYIGDVGEGN